MMNSINAPPRIRTLVVDDSPWMLRILPRVLEEAGHFDLIATATDGCQALRHVAALSPELVVPIAPWDRSRSGALPQRFSPREERALKHTTL